MIVPVILSGGSGTRLWPRSTEAQPKQFLCLAEERSMFAATLSRVSDSSAFAAPLIIGNAAHHALIARELEQAGCLGEARIVLEPIARNTAPAIALAALELGDDSLMLIMPSDHVIRDAQTFREIVAKASGAAQSGALVTFGITPSHPETGFGYIHQGARLAGDAGHKVQAFVEKPERSVAEQMLADGNYLWNAGIFLIRADRYLEELERFAPEIFRHCTAAFRSARRENTVMTPDQSLFAASPSDSIDYAIMEKAGNVAVFALDCGWSDLGSWAAVHDIAEKDGDANALSGPVTVIDSHDMLVQSDGIQIAAAGLEGLAIIAQGKQVAIVPLAEAQRVKALLAAVRKKEQP